MSPPIFEIVTVPSAVLREVCKPVSSFDGQLQAIIDSMITTARACDNPKAVGLAAPQVGVPLRLFVWLRAGYNWMAVANPKITRREGKITIAEACLSVPGRSFPKPRAAKIEVEYVDPTTGQATSMGVSDFEARIWQHECDHLDGRLFIDRASPKKRKGKS